MVNFNSQSFAPGYQKFSRSDDSVQRPEINFCELKVTPKLCMMHSDFL